METVNVSQAPAVSEVPAAVVPPAGGATMAALPAAVQDLARFFLNLAGSSSLGAVGGVVGAAASASGVGVQLCPSAPGGDAAASCAAAAVPAGLGGSSFCFCCCARLVRPSAVSGHEPAGVAIARPAMGPTERRRNVREVSLLPLVLFHAVGRGSIGRPPNLWRMPEPRPLLPELDVRLEVLLAIFDLLRQVAARLVLDLQVGRRGRPHERSVFAQVLVVDPPYLRVWRMTTSRVLSTRLTLTGMTLSGQSWPSSGTSTAWKNQQVSHRLDARLLLHRSMG